MSNTGLFRSLSIDEEREFRQWARDNYKPGMPINGIWHPVVQEECVRMNKEHAEQFTLQDFVVGLDGT